MPYEATVSSYRHPRLALVLTGTGPWRHPLRFGILSPCVHN